MLPLNFHRTFIPERRHIAALLEFAALGKEGTYQEISEQTGIPMGSSTGKVPAVLDYSRGMGLVEFAAHSMARSKKPVLTPLGRAVYVHDRILGDERTQWIVHMNMCRADIGAVAWRAVFAEGWRTLGSRFSRTEVEAYLSSIFGSGRDRTGPLLRTYLDESALGRAAVLVGDASSVERRRAPLGYDYSGAYAAIVLSLFETHFPTESQVTVPDLLQTSLWDRACAWSHDDIDQVCALLDRAGPLVVDRQTRPWVLERRATSADVWSRVYD